MRALFLALLALWVPSAASAATADVGIDQSGITFSKSTFYTGDDVRVYARIRNLGEVDMTAIVYFYLSDDMLGRAQPISLRAGGAPEEVFIDFEVPDGAFNIRAVLQGTDPADENLSNNEAMTPLYTPIADDDVDGVANDDDNCRDDANSNQRDTDGDGKGDVCDADDDDDSLTDSQESSRDTDPLDSDTDDDGVQDAEDAEPTDPTLTEERVVVVATPPAATKTVTALSGTSASQQASEDPIEETVSEPSVDRPDEAYALFSQIDPITGEPINDAPSFFRWENPWLYVLIIALSAMIAGGVASLVLLRRKNPSEDV